MNVNRMPAAFDNAGHVDELAIITSALIQERFGRPLRSKMAAFIFCGGRKMKAIEINSGEELAAAIKTFNPAAVSVAGVAAEHEIVAGVERGVAMMLSIPFTSSGVTK